MTIRTILLLWREEPEGPTKAFIFRNLSQEEMTVLDKAHGTRLNLVNDADADKACQLINLAINKFETEELDSLCENEEEKKWDGIWVANEVDFTAPIIEEIHKVVETGYMM